MMKNVVLIALVAASLTGSASLALAEEAGTKPPASVLQELKQMQADRARTDAYLATFDTLDFDVYTNQKWDRLPESHAEDILVHYPDGTTTRGLPAHIEALKPMFVFAPDTRIKVHPVRFGEGSWTGVIGVLEGSFTRPMPIGNGKTIPPTGKAFKLTMATLGHWNSAGVMDEEYLFWDNKELERQLGIGQ